MSQKMQASYDAMRALSASATTHVFLNTPDDPDDKELYDAIRALSVRGTIKVIPKEALEPPLFSDEARIRAFRMFDDMRFDAFHGHERK